MICSVNENRDLIFFPFKFTKFLNSLQALLVGSMDTSSIITREIAKIGTDECWFVDLVASVFSRKTRSSAESREGGKG